MVDSTSLSPILSICIATFNRAEFIPETLNSILLGLPPSVEIVVVDGASPDATASIMKGYCDRYPNVQYFKESHNSGVDADYDKAVAYARGTYCWLMSDDDLIKEGAIARVLTEISKNLPDLLIVNAELVSKDLSEVLDSNRLGIEESKEYSATTTVKFMSECASYLSFIGCVVIRRAVWMARRREDYYGSCFIHVGVIFQSPPLVKIMALAPPLISIRHGNSLWSPRSFEIWNFNWQNLIWSFPGYPDAVKMKLTPREPWRKLRTLIYARAMGSYSLNEYSKYIVPRVKGWRCALPWIAANFPPTLANLLVLTYFLVIKKGMHLAVYDLLRVKSARLAGRWLYKVFG